MDCPISKYKLSFYCTTIVYNTRAAKKIIDKNYGKLQFLVVGNYIFSSKNDWFLN
jgi:hypothetical protein